MTSRELIKAALTFQEVERIPTDREDTASVSFHYGKGRTSGVPEGQCGTRTDEWGCTWKAAENGVTGEVTNPLIREWSDLDSFTPPYDVLDEADLSGVDAQCEKTDKFVIPMWWVNYNLFERMQHLRGSEQLFIDIAEEEDDLYRLRDMVHEYYMRQAKMWAKTKIDGMHIADDWGSQTSLLISPAAWRRIFKPCYKEYCDLAHKHGKFVVMHSDGYIMDILPDLIEIGVDAVNSQLFCMDMDEIERLYFKKIAFWGEIDRQFALPFGTTEDCRKCVRTVAEKMMRRGRTGVVGQAFWGVDIPKENLDAVYDEWKKI